MNKSQEAMSPRNPSYAFTAGPEKLKSARYLKQKWLYGGREKSENLRLILKFTKEHEDWQTDGEQRKSNEGRKK